MAAAEPFAGHLVPATPTEQRDTFASALENKTPEHRKRRRQRTPTLRNALLLPDQPEEWELELLLPSLLAAYKECVADGASTNAA